METQTIINIAAIILSPLVAVMVGEFLRKRNFEKENRLKILSNLVAYRHKIDSDEFLTSLNSLNLFYKDEDLSTLIFELKKAYQNNSNNADAMIAKIIKHICNKEGFKHITIGDIDNLFKKR